MTASIVLSTQICAAMGIPLVLSVGPADVVPGDLGTVLPAGHVQNPFMTTSGWVLERWLAAWLAADAGNVLQALLPQITVEDTRNVIQLWRTLHDSPEFRDELRQVHLRWPAALFRRQVASLHLRILVVVMVHRLFRVDILRADGAPPLFSVPRFAHPNYQIHEELQNPSHLHPWLRPTFVLQPHWLARRSQWSMMALHTLMSAVQRLATWDAHRTWIVAARGLHRTTVAQQALYTRVPFGHDFASPQDMLHQGLYVDPTIALLLPRAATDLTSLVRQKPLWTRYSRKRGAMFQAVLQPGGIGHLCQWRSWRVVPVVNEVVDSLEHEPLYTPSVRKSKQSSALMHVREVMFEAYNRWFSKDFVPVENSEHREGRVYDAAFVPVENFLLTVLDGLVTPNGSMDADRATQLEAHAAAFLAHAKEQEYDEPIWQDARRTSKLYFLRFLHSSVLPMK